MSEIPTLTGRRVLLVEDEAMIAMLLEDMLADLGCEVIGPAYAIGHALELARAPEAIDVAILDVNVAGAPVFEVADALRARRVPMVFSTGYGEGGLRKQDKGAPILGKPFRAEDLAIALRQALAP
ncbi:MAG TPA: response regulator [Caulobacteraceae bacterium]|jgi:CheY-like chemotaxis protein|nr:response regulator [Caulobacteraceae bacterium]